MAVETLGHLEYDEVLKHLAEQTHTPMGRARALSLEPAHLREDANRLIAQSVEACALYDAGQPIPIRSCEAVDEALARLRAAGSLAGPELLAITQVLAMGRTLRRYLSFRKENATHLRQILTTDPALDSVEDDVRAAFDPDGTLADHASPRLRELRGEYKTSRSRLLSRMEELAKKYAHVLQDSYVTEREGRYVLPVRSDAHDRFPGIVHTSSSSGGTLFVEPRFIIPIGNRLKVLEGDVMREEQAVLAHLSSLLYEVLPSVEEAVDMVARADVLHAVSKLRSDHGFRFAELVDAHDLSILNAKHPLLVLRGVNVIPSDLFVDQSRALIISGPNAGGKTVALKTLGLCALMVRAGLPIGCLEGSKLGFFDSVLTDIGDEQSLSRDLSTFSAHIKNVSDILDRASPGTLVLLDELCGGTDPREGEALAAGILDSLCARGATVACTTHYEGLKALALADNRFRNASVGVTTELDPTFRLALDIPGKSSALVVARRYGLAETVIARAEKFLTREDLRFEDLVSKLHEERAALEMARTAVVDHVNGLRQEREQVREELEKIRAREKKEAFADLEKLHEKLRRAREDLHEAQAVLRQRKYEAEGLKEAAKKLDHVARSLAEARTETVVDDAHVPVGESHLRGGARVFVNTVRREGVIQDVLPDGQVRVAVGSMKLVVPQSVLRASAQQAQESKKSRATAMHHSSPLEVAIQTSDNTCDVRGMRVEDAVSLAVSFVDRAITDSRKVVFLVHGHGTGALRDAVRAELRTLPHVAHFRAGGQGEGGDGATIVWIT